MLTNASGLVIHTQSELLTSRTAAIIQSPYRRLPDSNYKLQSADEPQNFLLHNETALIALVFLLLLIIILLTYFLLFIYQRVRFPQTEPRDEFDLLDMEAARHKRDEGANLVMTKDELLGRVNVMEGAAEKAETVKTVQSMQKADQDRAEPKLEVSKDAPSDPSEDANESVHDNDFLTKEEANEVDDGPEKFAIPSSERGKFRLSIEGPRHTSAEPNGKSSRAGQSRDDKKRNQYVAEYAEAYRQTVRREGRVTSQQKMAPLTDFNKLYFK